MKFKTFSTRFLTYGCLASIAVAGCSVQAATPRFKAPTTQAELDARIVELRQHYAPFLRSLPEKLPGRSRSAMPAQWKFQFEAKESPKIEGVPPAPPFHTIELDDSKWMTTTVPEWRYRTREGDTAIEPGQVDQWKNHQTTADTICWYRSKFAAKPTEPGKRDWLCFDGVEWEAQVWLNGEPLGTHRVYYEPFRFEVTGKLKEINTLAVRVISGRSYGQPVSYWTLLPDIRASVQRYEPDRSRSIPGNIPIGYHSGCGFGIYRAVYLEQSGPVLIDTVFARNDLSDGNVRVKMEIDGHKAREAELAVDILPENNDGHSYRLSKRVLLSWGRSVQSVEIPMPDANLWAPEAPNLYRCRVTVAGSDAKDVLFGCRSFALVQRGQTLPDGLFLLNGKPTYLRGTNIQGLNAWAYWGQSDELLHALLLLKAGNFNVVRSCQHVEFPEVREWMDRIGVMSEQDQGGGYSGSIDLGIRREQHIHTGTVLARETYNNPGVVLLCFGNEHHFDTEPILRAALAVDPQRVFKPISGRFSHSKEPLQLSYDLWPNVIDDGHPYSGWYGTVKPQTWSNLKIFPPRRLVTLGEFGAEALDSYETMRDHYPSQFQSPAADADSLWAASQVQKHDVKQTVGLGRDPKNLAEYIEASQNYQEGVLADKTIGMRLSPKAVAGYFQFHFMDVIPVFWPKSIVSHDFQPKKAYFQMAQINQPLVALPQLTGTHPDGMTLWVANDLGEAFPHAILKWAIAHDETILLEGQRQLDVPPLSAVAGETIDLSPISAKCPSFEVRLSVTDTNGNLLSRYRRTVRVVPEELLKTENSAMADPFNKKK